MLGESVGEIAARSRSSHRSQGYGTVATRGSRLDDFQPLDGKPARKDLFDGIDTTWTRWPSAGEVGPMIDEVIAHFDPQAPAASVPALIRIRKMMLRDPENEDTVKPGEQWSIFDKVSLLDRIVQDCLGLYFETTVAQAEVVSGETLHLRHTVLIRSGTAISRLVSVSPATKQPDPITVADDETVLHENQSLVREVTYKLPDELPVAQPFWLRGSGTEGLYGVEGRDDEYSESVYTAENLSALRVFDTLVIDGEVLSFISNVTQVTADPSKGEVRRELAVILPVSLAVGRDVQLFAPGSERTVEVEVRAQRADQSGTLRLATAAGWIVVPAEQPFHLTAVGDHARVAFTVRAPTQPGTAELTVEATVGERTYSTTRQEIRYEHIPFQLLQPPAHVKAVCLDLAFKGRQVGYLPGAGDNTAEALAAMGYNVITLSGADLTPARLREFDAVVVGVRAFNVRTDLAAGLSALFAYAENGGTVVEQYNTPNELKNPSLAPYALELSRNLPQQRVTNENAPVTLLAPDHPAFNVPNKLTPADFDGWVQERGLNFPVTWDREHFEALLACGDPGEAPLKSGLLVAHHGKGYFIYTGLSFFRQLPAGVPGAYRLFANLVSLGK